MKERLFRFKRFNVRHERSAMKVGVDAVLLGAYADVSGAARVLDVGTGCGVIALCVAQRNPVARIEAIDIDAPSVDEARVNFALSHWADRLNARCVSFDDFVDESPGFFNLIVSNPPFFSSGVNSLTDSRMRARHEGALSPEAILRKGVGLLAPDGRIAIIVPADREEDLIQQGSESGLLPARLLRVKGTPASAPKRLIAEFMPEASAPAGPETAELVIQTAPECYTEEYRLLTRDFYLRF